MVELISGSMALNKLLSVFSNCLQLPELESAQRHEEAATLNPGKLDRPLLSPVRYHNRYGGVIRLF